MTEAPAAAPSPFRANNPTMQYAWDATSLSALKRCPRYYEYTIIHGLRAKGESVHLVFGGEYALALETYHKLRARGAGHDDALDAVVDQTLQRTWRRDDPEKPEGYPWQSDHNAKTRMNLIRSIVWYLEEFSLERDPAKVLMLHDGQPAVELSFKFEPGIEDFWLCGHMDRIVTYGDETYVMDQKTTGSTLGGYYFDGYNPDTQMSLYTLAGQVVFNLPVAGVIIDAAQIAVGFTSFARGITMRSRGQLEEYLGDFRVWTQTALRYSEAGHWPMNESSCGNYGGCAFRKICGKDPAVRETYLSTYFEERKWNPLEPR